MVAQGDFITENQPKITNDFRMKHRDDLTEEQQKLLKNLLVEYSDIFVENPKDPPETHLVSHVINTGDPQPVRSQLRRFFPQWAKEMDTQIKEMMKNGICRPSKSPWSGQVLLVKKKDGTWRFVVDNRKLNDYTIRDRYPMPNITDLIDDVQGSNICTCLDLPSAYWHIPVEESSIEKKQHLKSQKESMKC